MSRPPRPPDEPLITRRRALRILYHGGLNAAAAAVAFYAVYRGAEENLPRARTAAFCTLAFAQLVFSFGCRSFRYTLPQLGVFSNRWLLGAIGVSVLLQLLAVSLPPVRLVFQVETTGFTWEWALIAALALAPVTVVEVSKLLRAARRGGAE
jgi:magnesium-transporting ATPase (P-type)